MNGITALIAVLVVFHLVVFAVAPLLNEHRRRAFRRRFRVSMTPVAAAWTVALVGCVLLAVVGEIPYDHSWDRGTFRAVWAWGLLLVAGTAVGSAGIAGGLAVGRRMLRFRAGGSEFSEDPIVTGRAVPVTGPEPSPIFERPAVCWTWTLEARDRWGGDSGWETARSGSGGVPFRVEPETDEDTATIDPDAAHVTVRRSKSAHGRPDSPAPGRLDRIPRTDVGGTEHRYSEGVIASGETVTVVGERDETGRIIDDGGVEPWITAGDRATVVRRLWRYTAGYLGGGAIVLLVSLSGYLSWLGLW